MHTFEYPDIRLLASSSNKLLLPDTATAGVELEESVCGLGDGNRGGTRLFSCASGRALFVPLPLCRRDARFRDTPPPDRADLHDGEHFDQVCYLRELCFL